MEGAARSAAPEASVDRVQFRLCRPTDIPVCLEIETASYPPDEAATLSSLQYRQHHAAPFFLCAVNPADDDTDTVIGFICSTKCLSFQHESMTTHVPNGSLLAIHSVVIAAPYRRRGLATRMLREYIEMVQQIDPVHRPEKIVLLAKANLLAFYVKCGFQVM
jgi:ribosomal protein S18 acetylase RimI-like enzyme